MVPVTFDGSSGALASAPFVVPPVPVQAVSSRAVPAATARTVRRDMCISSVHGSWDGRARAGWLVRYSDNVFLTGKVPIPPTLPKVFRALGWNGLGSVHAGGDTAHRG